MIERFKQGCRFGYVRKDGDEVEFEVIGIASNGNVHIRYDNGQVDMFLRGSLMDRDAWLIKTAEAPGAWRLEFWYISGVHTGWRIIRGYGLNLEVHSGYAFNWTKPGDYEIKHGEAKRAYEELIQQ